MCIIKNFSRTKRKTTKMDQLFSGAYQEMNIPLIAFTILSVLWKNIYISFSFCQQPTRTNRHIYTHNAYRMVFNDNIAVILETRLK